MAAETVIPESDRATQFYKWTRGLTAAALQSLLYFGINHAHLTRSTEILRTSLDDAIPFWTWTAWFYLPFYAGIFIICIVVFRSRRQFNRPPPPVLFSSPSTTTSHTPTPSTSTLP